MFDNIKSNNNEKKKKRKSQISQKVFTPLWGVFSDSNICLHRNLIKPKASQWSCVTPQTQNTSPCLTLTCLSSCSRLVIDSGASNGFCSFSVSSVLWVLVTTPARGSRNTYFLYLCNAHGWESVEGLRPYTRHSICVIYLFIYFKYVISKWLLEFMAICVCVCL